MRGQCNERQHNNQMARQKAMARQEIVAGQEAMGQLTGHVGGNGTLRGGGIGEGISRTVAMVG
jgi:hypothetical protein